MEDRQTRILAAATEYIQAVDQCRAVADASAILRSAYASTWERVRAEADLATSRARETNALVRLATEVNSEG